MENIVESSQQPAPSRLYAHWLDGEWLKIAHRVAVERPYRTLKDIAEGVLKLHALFGTRIVISDVQLTDSEVMVRLFANKEFRNYLKIDPGFLTLIASPRPGISDERLAVATSGIAKVSDQYWTTSLPGISVDVIKRFAEPILSADKPETARWIRDRSKGPGHIITVYPDHQEILEGMLHGICHFAKKTGGPLDAPSDSPRFYTNFIEDALNAKGILPDDYGVLEEVWESITKWVPDESMRFARSSLLKAMNAKERDRNKWPLEWHRIWNTVVHAWNSNVCDTVRATGASIASLPEAVVPFRGEISNMAGPFKRRDLVLRPKISRRYPVFYFDPSTLTWSLVRNVVKSVRGKRNKFIEALHKGSADEVEGASSELIHALNDNLVPHSRPALPHWVWFLLSVVGHFCKVPVHEVALGDETRATILTLARRAKVLNTLHGFKRDLVAAFRRTHGE